MNTWGNNAEFNRNLWIEFSWPRVLVALVLLGILLWIALAIEQFRFLDASIIESLSLGITYFALWLGAPYQVSQSLHTEWSQHTWDSQRLSPITPWSLLWGKVMGSAIYSWYIAALALLVYGLAPVFFETHAGGSDRALRIALALTGGILMQSAAFMLALFELRANRLRSARSAPLAILFFGFFVALPILKAFGKYPSIEWYGYNYPAMPFLLACTTSLAVWSVYGAYRIIRDEFLYRNGPLPWLLFSFYLPLLATGFLADPVKERLPTLVGISLAMVYGLALSTPANLLAWKHLFGFARMHQWQRAAETIPLWANGLPACLVFMTIAIHGTWPDGAGVYLGMTGFLVRDLCIIHLPYLGNRPQRAPTAATVWLMVLYLLLPWLMSVLHAHQALAIFLPFQPDAAYWAWGEACLALGWLAFRWKQFSSNTTRSAGPQGRA